MLGYIYIITNLVNNKKYIGQRRAFEGSPEDDNYYGSGTLITRAVALYGKENFKRDIIEYCNTIEELNEAEIKWIKHYDAVVSDEFYNIAWGGFSGDTWTGRPEEDKEAFREIIRESNKNRVRNPENITGNKNPAFGKKWCNDGVTNYLLSQEDIQTKNLTIVRIRTKEHNMKIAKALKGKKKNYSSTGGKICITLEGINKFIAEKELAAYESTGWIRGMNKKRRYKK